MSLRRDWGARADGGLDALSATARDYTLGWRWMPAADAPGLPRTRSGDLAFGLRATRRESEAAAPEHTVGVEVRATW